MRILGIDPGFAIVGYGLLDYDGMNFKVLNYGAITTDPETEFRDRLVEIYDDMNSLLDMSKPDCVSIEMLFFNTNITTGINVAQARGVTVLAAAQKNIPIFEYTPLQVKVAVTGYGYAKKPQVQEMTRNILHLKKIPKPDDAADALAIAICHGHSGTSLLSKIKK